MKPGALIRRTILRRGAPLRRRRRRIDDRVTPALAGYVFARDSYRCIASRFDPAHRCEGRLTIEHVPEAGRNATGKRAPSDRWHLVAACLGAQQGWCLTNRDAERAWLASVEPAPLPSQESTSGFVST